MHVFVCRRELCPRSCASIAKTSSRRTAASQSTRPPVLNDQSKVTISSHLVRARPCRVLVYRRGACAPTSLRAVKQDPNTHRAPAGTECATLPARVMQRQRRLRAIRGIGHQVVGRTQAPSAPQQNKDTQLSDMSDSESDSQEGEEEDEEDEKAESVEDDQAVHEV